MYSSLSGIIGTGLLWTFCFEHQSSFF